MASLGSRPPAEIAGQALSFAQQNGYSSADVALIQDLVLSLQVWRPGDVASPAAATPATTPGNEPAPTASIDVTPTDGGAP